MKFIYVLLGCILSISVFANQAKVNVDVSQETGKIRALNGGNLGPQISNEDAGYNIRNDFGALNIPITRLHDVPLNERGLRIVDTDLIFANSHADENDARNYYFLPTDDYIESCLKCGTKIFYRLGVSIDHTARKYKTTPPDAQKWARICIKIIEHYNEGWANGFHHNIEYWEIWNEHECKNASGKKTMWAGTTEEYNKFYVEVSKIIKKRFPNIKIGGPAHVFLNPQMLEQFLETLKQNNAPLDFYSWHGYMKNVGDYAAQPAKVKKILEKYGFDKTELHFNEWHYFPLSWKELRSDGIDKDKMYDKIRNAEAGVFTNAVLTAWQDTPLDCAYLYTVGMGNWGIFDNFCRKYKLYYSYKAFGELTKFPKRLKASSDNKNVYVLAGKNPQGQNCILINAFKTGALELKVKIDGADAGKIKSAQVFVFDEKRNLEPVKDFSVDGNVIGVNLPEDSSCVMIKM